MGIESPRTSSVDALLDRSIFSTYLAGAWPMRFADLGLALLLAALRALLPHPSTQGLVVLKATLAGVAPLGLAATIILARPYHALKAWQGHVRAALLVVTAGTAALNACVSAQALGWGGSSVSSSIAWGSYALLASWSFALVLLITCFARAVWTSAHIEKKAMEARRSRAQPQPSESQRVGTNIVNALAESAGGMRRKDNPALQFYRREYNPALRAPRRDSKHLPRTPRRDPKPALHVLSDPDDVAGSRSPRRAVSGASTDDLDSPRSVGSAGAKSIQRENSARRIARLAAGRTRRVSQENVRKPVETQPKETESQQSRSQVDEGMNDGTISYATQ